MRQKKKTLKVVQFTNILTPAPVDLRSPSTDFSRPLIKSYVTKKYQNGVNRIIWLSMYRLRYKRQCFSHLQQVITSKGKVSEKLLKF